MTDPAGPGPPPPRGRWSYRVEARSAAPVESVWPLLGEAGRWKEWSFLDRTGLETPGSPVPDGVGAVRRFTRFGVGSREEVVAYEPPHHLGYAVLSGFPVRHYRSDIVLAPDGPGGGTHLTWAGTFDEIVPGTGALLAWVLHRMIGSFATAVARHAEAPG